MARRLDKIIVVDVEATCSDNGTVTPEASEIIEIGVCLLDVKTGERSDIEPSWEPNSRWGGCSEVLS